MATESSVFSGTNELLIKTFWTVTHCHGKTKIIGMYSKIWKYSCNDYHYYGNT